MQDTENTQDVAEKREKLAKLLAQNKAKNEVFSYRQALNEAWKELEEFIGTGRIAKHAGS